MLSIPTVVSTFWETSECREPMMCSGFARLPDLCILETECREGNMLDMCGRAGCYHCPSVKWMLRDINAAI